MCGDIMNTIKDTQIKFLQPPNSIIKDYSVMVETILSEIRLKCAVPKHLLEKDKFYLYKSFMRTQKHIDNILVKLYNKVMGTNVL